MGLMDRKKMRNKGEIRIGVFGIIFIILVILACIGKTSFWHVVLFPFYAIFGCLGGILSLILGFACLFGLVILGIWAFCKFHR